MSARAQRFAVVAARWNEAFVKRMVDSALDTLRREGVPDDHVQLTWVPGSHELPVAASLAARSGRTGNPTARDLGLRIPARRRREAYEPPLQRQSRRVAQRLLHVLRHG